MTTMTTISNSSLLERCTGINVQNSNRVSTVYFDCAGEFQYPVHFTARRVHFCRLAVFRSLFDQPYIRLAWARRHAVLNRCRFVLNFFENWIVLELRVHLYSRGGHREPVEDNGKKICPNTSRTAKFSSTCWMDYLLYTSMSV